MNNDTTTTESKDTTSLGWLAEREKKETRVERYTRYVKNLSLFIEETKAALLGQTAEITALTEEYENCLGTMGPKGARGNKEKREKLEAIRIRMETAMVFRFQTRTTLRQDQESLTAYEWELLKARDAEHQVSIGQLCVSCGGNPRTFCSDDCGTQRFKNPALTHVLGVPVPDDWPKAAEKVDCPAAGCAGGSAE